MNNVLGRDDEDVREWFVDCGRIETDGFGRWRKKVDVWKNILAHDLEELRSFREIKNWSNGEEPVLARPFSPNASDSADFAEGKTQHSI